MKKPIDKPIDVCYDVTIILERDHSLSDKLRTINMKEPFKFKVGDRVVCLLNPNNYPKFDGKTGTVQGLFYYIDKYPNIVFKPDDFNLSELPVVFSQDFAKLVEPKIKLGEYTVQFDKPNKQVKVGCVTVTKSQVEEILKRLNE